MDIVMDDIRIPSIKISTIEMSKCYFNPGRALSIYKPESGQKIMDMLNTHFGTVQLHSMCCHHNPQLPYGSTIINNCAGCDVRFRSLYEGIQTISLWEVLDGIEIYHSGSYRTGRFVQDPCGYRPKPQVHAAFRSMLQKMNVEIIDSKYSGTKSICCGYHSYPQLPIEKTAVLQKGRAAQLPCQDVAVFCVVCTETMIIGGKNPRYVVDLVLNEETEPQETRIDVFQAIVSQYREAH